jgi:hypothetical protein
MMSRIWRQIPDKPTAIDAQVRSAASRRVSIKLPDPGTAYPVLRTNALLVTSPPKTCGTVAYGEELFYGDVNDWIMTAKPNATIAVTDRLLYWGKNAEIEKILDPSKIKAFETFILPDPIDAMARQPFLKPFFEAGLVRALCEGKPLQLERQHGIFYAVVRHEEATSDAYKPLRETLSAFGKPGAIAGFVPKLNRVQWAEAVAMRLEERNGKLWLLLRPDVWVSPEAPRQEARDFLRARKLYRYNNQSNALLSEWINLLLGHVGGAAAKVVSFPGSDQPCTYEISTRSAYSRGIADVRS